ncbi:MAG: hypothetical protein JWN70_6284 [Planctomycetaceae bacterium]|nr:hypothetical protein [Planctomycetaceae bacterium]
MPHHFSRTVLAAALILTLWASTASAQSYSSHHHHHHSGYNGYYGSSYYGGSYFGYSWANEIQRQRAINLALQNRKDLLKFNREWHQIVASDREALHHARTEQHIQTDERHFRDLPDAAHIASGATLNYLLKQFGSNLMEIDFKKVNLTADELASVRLKNADGFTAEGLAWTEDSAGKILWPEELQWAELDGPRQAVEAAVKKLQQLDQDGQPVDTQVKRVEHEIGQLRSSAGSLLRLKKHDDIGANASREFLKTLQYRIVQASSSERLQQIRSALHPQVNSTQALMQHIARYDLHFAPCADPAAPAYHTLQDKLAAVHRALHGSTPSLAAGK